jgi:hypothetical protein
MVLSRGKKMSTKSNLLQAHQTMMAVLDAKLKNVPEWIAFRAIDKALVELTAEPASSANGAIKDRQPRKGAEPSSYVDLAAEALAEHSEPLSTPKIVEYISARREVPNDPLKARVNISTSLSKDERFRNLAWRGGRAWWFANREPPEESAGLSANS